MNGAWWWLSFVRGDSFAGVAIVRGHTLIEAARAAHAIGCNPGGQVMGMPAPASLGDPPTQYTNRLLMKAECNALCMIWMPENPRCATVGELESERTS